MLSVKDLGYDSWQTVYFQRATVILSELVLVYALHLYSHHQRHHNHELTHCQLRKDI
jgi:alpha-1,3-glucosyltransferase